MTSSYQVVWKGPVNKASGLGIASREYVKALRRQGVSTAIGAVRGRASKKRKVLVYHYSPNTLKIQKESSIARQFRHLFAEKGQLWAEPDIGSLRRQMRKAYENPLLCRMKGRRGRQNSLKLSWNRAGFSLKKAIEKVIRKKK